MEKLPELKIF